MGRVATYRSAGPLGPLIAGNMFPTAQRYAARTVRTRHLNIPAPKARVKTYE